MGHVLRGVCVCPAAVFLLWRGRRVAFKSINSKTGATVDIANAAAAIFSQNGLAVGLIAVGIAALWYVCQWTAKNVVKPLMAAHTRFLDRLALCMEDNTRLLASLDDRSLAQLEINREQLELTREIHRHAMSGKDRDRKPAVHKPEQANERG